MVAGGVSSNIVHVHVRGGAREWVLNVNSEDYPLTTGSTVILESEI